MKRAISLAFIGIAIIGLALAAGQTSLKVTILDMEPFIYVSLSHTGPYSDIPEVIGQLMEAIQEQTITPTGPVMIIFQGAPPEAPSASLRWEAGFPVSEQAGLNYHIDDDSAVKPAPDPTAASPLPALDKKEWKYTKVAVCVHSGSYESTEDTIKAMMEWIEENGYTAAGPVVERYTDMDDATGNPQDLKIEIWVPLQVDGRP